MAADRCDLPLAPDRSILSPPDPGPLTPRAPGLQVPLKMTKSMAWPRCDPSFQMRRRGRAWLHPRSHVWRHTWGASSEPVPRPQRGPNLGSGQAPAGQGSGPRQLQAQGPACGCHPHHPRVPVFTCALESRPVLSNSLWPHGLYSPWNSPGQNTGVGSHTLLQGIFPTQGSNPGPPHCRQIPYQLSRQGSPEPLPNSLWKCSPHSSSFHKRHSSAPGRGSRVWGAAASPRVPPHPEVPAPQEAARAAPWVSVSPAPTPASAEVGVRCGLQPRLLCGQPRPHRPT